MTPEQRHRHIRQLADAVEAMAAAGVRADRNGLLASLRTAFGDIEADDVLAALDHLPETVQEAFA